MSVIFNLLQPHISPHKCTKKRKREKRICVTVCVSVLLTVKSDEERHGHWLKGNSTLSHIGPKTFAALFFVVSNFGACCVSGHTQTSDVEAGV